MARTQYYRYNPETDNFERVFPTFRRRITSLARLLALSLIVGGILFLVAYYVIDTPGERRLREQNAVLKQQYEILNRRFDNAQKVMDNIQNRDDNLYRVLLQMEPVTDIHRYAGLNNDRRYRELTQLSDGGLLKYMTQRMDFLERQLYAQSLSFDQIKEQASQQRQNLDRIPSLLPVDKDRATLSGGYGMRRDPVTGLAVFHAGLDYAATAGTPVYATADGKVITAERKNMYGNIVEIDHGYGYVSRYAHLSKMSVKPGTLVKAGKEIGAIGSTGRSTGPHLHYEVRFKGEAQNPINYSYKQLNPREYSRILTEAENASNIMD